MGRRKKVGIIIYHLLIIIFVVLVCSCCSQGTINKLFRGEGERGAGPDDGDHVDITLYLGRLCKMTCIKH